MTQPTEDVTDPRTEGAVESDPSGEIIARPDGRYRFKHMTMAVLLILGGCWFAYDGWINWPRQNALAQQWEAALSEAQNAPVKDPGRIETLVKDLKSVEKHNDANVLLQKVLACALPLMGIFWGAWTLSDTSGQYRMENETLEVPGHPPITTSDIRRIDKRRWDRKGIALIHYEHGDPPQSGVLKLDDFAYQRQPTDAILARIEQALTGSSEALEVADRAGESDA
jgi:hypothetical protein